MPKEVELHLTLMFIHTPTSSLRRNWWDFDPILAFRDLPYLIFNILSGMIRPSHLYDHSHQMHREDLLTFLTFEKTLCLKRWNFILLWCSFILLLPPLGKIDAISVLSSLGGTCLISSSMFRVGWCRLGFILSLSDLPYLLSQSWVDLALPFVC